MESMMSLLPTTEMLHESTFAIEQQIQHLDKRVQEQYCTKKEFNRKLEGLRKELIKMFV